MKRFRRRLFRWLGDRLLLPDGMSLELAVMASQSALNRQRELNREMLARLTALEGGEYAVDASDKMDGEESGDVEHWRRRALWAETVAAVRMLRIDALEADQAQCEAAHREKIWAEENRGKETPAEGDGPTNPESSDDRRPDGGGDR